MAQGLGNLAVSQLTLILLKGQNCDWFCHLVLANKGINYSSGHCESQNGLSAAETQWYLDYSRMLWLTFSRRNYVPWLCDTGLQIILASYECTSLYSRPITGLKLQLTSPLRPWLRALCEKLGLFAQTIWPFKTISDVQTAGIRGFRHTRATIQKQVRILVHYCNHGLIHYTGPSDAIKSRLLSGSCSSISDTLYLQV